MAVPGLPSTLLIKQYAKPVESFLPKRLARGNPPAGEVKALGLEGARSDTADLLRVDKPARLQHLYVLNDRRQCHLQGLCEIGRPRRSLRSRVRRWHGGSDRQAR
jgi:hypothetical protein